MYDFFGWTDWTRRRLGTDVRSTVGTDLPQLQASQFFLYAQLQLYIKYIYNSIYISGIILSSVLLQAGNRILTVRVATILWECAPITHCTFDHLQFNP